MSDLQQKPVEITPALGLAQFLFKHRFIGLAAHGFCSCGNCPDSVDRDRDVWQWWSAHVEREWTRATIEY